MTWLVILTIFLSFPVWGIGPDQTEIESIDDVFSDDTPVELEDMRTEQVKPDGDLWVKPDYSNQQGALGYSEGLFAVPPELQKRFEFWKDIYSKFTSEQGVLHDSKYIDVIYKEVDFRPIAADPSMNDVQKHIAKKRLVKKLKKEIVDTLYKFQKIDDSKTKDVSGLTPEELDLWKRFETITGNKKFIDASRDGRLRFQLGQKDRIELGIFYSGRYLRRMEQIFRDEKLPVELTRMPFVESSFNIYARSKVGASGIWQFVPRTGRQYMKINTYIDERNDPLMATKASARLLKTYYNLLQKWPLAITGYNHGAYGLHRAVKRLGTTNLHEIIERDTRRSFGFAGENFYSCLLAILHVEGNADQYFGAIKRSPELNFERIDLQTTLPWEKLVSWFDGGEEQAKLFNPHINYRVRRGNFYLPPKVYIHVPTEKKETILAAIEELKKGPALARAKMKSAKAIAGNAGTYYVRKGDTLSHIARHLGVTVKELMEFNNISSPKLIRPGLRLDVPVTMNE